MHSATDEWECMHAFTHTDSQDFNVPREDSDLVPPFNMN